MILLETKRLLRNKRTMISVLLMPIILSFLFTSSAKASRKVVGVGNLSAFLVVSIALYGAVQAASFGGSVISLERVAGWSRQLRTTPLSATAYIAIKTVTSLALSFMSLAAVFVVGILNHKAHMPAEIWVACAACVWIGSLVFAVFGIFMGYLVPSENAMQFIAFGLLLFSFAGGLFIPLSSFPHMIREIAYYTPLYGLDEIVHYPLLQSNFDVVWLLNAAVWFAIFFTGAVIKFKQDTKRV